ncbi:MAG: MFS transporter [Candidatus Eisenbacteria bacterium]|nr:MFS transporter [Candidatus Eisenbacteria bacterium]
MKPGPRLPRTVVGLGLVSLFTDLSSEAIFPLLPAFLVSLGSSSAFIGLVEGAAELVSNTLKFVMGRVTDRRARLKPLVLLGYGVSTVVRPMVAFAAAPWHVLLVRVGDRVGKGVRTTPRDALIASVVDPSIRARAYGFHRAMDHAGAVAGTLFAAGLLWLLGASAGVGPENAARMRTVFLWAAVPGFAAMLALALTPEPAARAMAGTGGRPIAAPAKADADAAHSGAGSASASAAGGPGALPPALKRALVALTIFAIANATDAFLIVKAAKLGASPALAPMLWLTLHLVKAATATQGGRLADRYGKRNALVLGWCVYGVLWGAIGFVQSLPLLFVLTAVYGISHGLVEGAERGLIADLAAGHGRGAAFGAYNMLIGLAALLASTAFGAVWDRWGSVAAFVGSASFALVAAGVLFALVPGAPGSTRGGGTEGSS